MAVSITERRRADDLRSLERSLDLVETAAFRVGIFLLVLVVAFAVAIWASSGSWIAGSVIALRALVMAALVIAAAGAIGCAMGFLFGIPRLLQGAAARAKGEGAATPAPTGQNARFFSTNTSLEEISDWLTKIIIGIGLVQFEQITEYLFKVSVAIAAYVHAVKVNFGDIGKTDLDQSVSVVFFFSLIVASLLYSCLFVYLQTRTRITFLFVGVEAASGNPDLAELAGQKLTEDGSVTALATAAMQPAILPLSAEEKALLNSISRADLSTPMDIAGWATLQARDGSYLAAEDALRDAIQRSPDNVDFLLRLAEVRKVRQNASGYVDAILEATRKRPDNAAVSKMAEAAQLDALYLTNPDSIARAIELSEYLVGAGGKAAEPYVQLRRACAWGQQYRFEKRSNAADVNLTNSRTKALEAVRRVKELAPDMAAPVRQEMLRLYDPAGQKSDPNENDLEVFNPDPDFDAAMRT